MLLEGTDTQTCHKTDFFLKTEKNMRKSGRGSGGGATFLLSPILKISRQCPLVFLVEVYLSEASGKDKV
jgi:hypothetical protein